MNNNLPVWKTMCCSDHPTGMNKTSSTLKEELLSVSAAGLVEHGYPWLGFNWTAHPTNDFIQLVLAAATRRFCNVKIDKGHYGSLTKS